MTQTVSSATPMQLVSLWAGKEGCDQSTCLLARGMAKRLPMRGVAKGASKGRGKEATHEGTAKAASKGHEMHHKMLTQRTFFCIARM